LVGFLATSGSHQDWRSAGYFVVSAYSIGEAINLFNDGDFDLVVLGDSVSIENRQRLTSMIRASGSQTPMACIGTLRRPQIAFRCPTEERFEYAGRGLRELLAQKAMTAVAPAILRGEMSYR